MINVGLIGYGYWGPNLVRNFAENPDFQVKSVADLRPERLELIKGRYPYIHLTENNDEVLTDPGIDAIVIATPISTHFDLALKALENGKHVLVEKPLTSSSEHASRLIEEAKKRKLILMVDHTFVYTSEIRKIKEIMDQKEIGDMYYYDSIRINLGLFQHDVNVIWDLAVHDFSIMDYLFASKPIALTATGINNVPSQHENLAYITLFFQDKNLIAHVNVNWLSPVKVRQVLIGGSQKMVVYDALHPSEQVRIYDKGVVVDSDPVITEKKLHKLMVEYRTGDMLAPRIVKKEALEEVVKHFHECIATGKKPITDGEMGLRIVKLLEAANQSLKEQGRIIKTEI